MKHISHHFVMIISPGIMEIQASYFIKSLMNKGMHRKYDYKITIFTDDMQGITNEFLIEISNILSYCSKSDFLYPWTSCPRWNIESDCDLIIGVDSDVVCVGDYMDQLSSYAQYDINGLQAFRNPLKTDEWKFLFNELGIEWPCDLYRFEIGETGPYYINNGVVVVKNILTKEIRNEYDNAVGVVNKYHYDNFYIAQIATTLMAYKLDLKKNFFNYGFHTLGINSYYGKKTVFYHYLDKSLNRKTLKMLNNALSKKRFL